jgi:hypothetical protein
MLAQLINDCFYSMMSQGSVLQSAVLDIIGHNCVTWLSQIISQWGISKWCVTCVRELLDFAIDKECFGLLFCVNP